MKIPLLFALVGTLGACSWAQTSTAPLQIDTAQSEQKRMYRIQLKNVAPSLMAYWLDPANHLAPHGFEGSISYFQPGVFGEGPNLLRTEGMPITPDGSLPARVDRIVPGGSQNPLLVYGSVQGAGNLAPQLNALDRPLRQVEIEAQFIRVNSDAFSKLFPNDVSKTSNDLSQRTLKNVDGGFRGMLRSLEQSGQAMTIAAPRALTANNVSASLRHEAQQPVRIARPGDTPTVKGLPSATLYLQNIRSMQVTPTINDNDTVTLAARIEQDVELKGALGASDGIKFNTGEPVQFLAALGDGQSLATPLEAIPGLAEPGYTTLVVLTARIVKHTGDK